MNNSTLYVKGFIDFGSDIMHKIPSFTGNFQAVLTDLTETIVIDVTSATKENGQWKLIRVDGEILTLSEEPDEPRYISHSTLITNFYRDFFGDKFTRIPRKKYEEVFEEIVKGSEAYRLCGYVNGQKVVTGPLVKIWNGEEDDAYYYHGITKSGTHYVF